MILHDHSKVRLQRRASGDYAVIDRATSREIGTVYRSRFGRIARWAYRLSGDEVGTGYWQTREDAIDHLLSADSPSASWLN